MSEFIGAHGARIADENWQRIRPFVLDAVADMNFARIHEAKNYFTVSARFVDWASRVAGQPLERSQIFRPEVIDNFVISGCNDLAKSTRATYRSRLLQMSDKLLDRPYRTPYAIRMGAFGNASSPIAPDDVARLRMWARWQNTQYRQVNATVLLALGLGAGLTTSEITAVRAVDIVVDHEGVQVQVGGRRPRIVPLRHEWEEPIATLAKAAMRPATHLFSPRRRTPNSPTLISNFISDATAAPTRLNPQRMRATWIVNHMANRVPPAVLARAAGLDSPDGLLRFAAFVPEVDETEVRRWLRDARDPNEGASR